MNDTAVRILILDDEPFMHQLLAQMLTQLGFTSITTCDNGLAALAWVASPVPPNLILLDLSMPEMDGIEFVRKLVEKNYTGSLILVSGVDERLMQMAEKLIEAHQITVLGRLTKPVSLAELSSVVSKWTPAQYKHRVATNNYGAAELRVAIANGELINWYQPKVAVTTGEVVGVETLVRWNHPMDGLVFPDQFIRAAEEHGVIDELTREVLSGALAQANLWQQAGLLLQVAVNISMNNLSTLTFADFVAKAALMADISPHNLVLEITESRLMVDQRVPLEILTRLRMKGFRLSIDDFGTGHSSLAQLRDISFDELKIDKSFVHGAAHDNTALAMYNASLGLGKQLGMQVVAEGVEDSEDWDLVQRTGCDQAQGYFIARPMPATDLPGWIRSWKGQVQRMGAHSNRRSPPQVE